MLVVTAAAVATPRDGAGHPAAPSTPTDGLVYVWMTFEPDEARRLWACFDQPDLKAVHRFTVLAPEAWTVTNNSAPESIEPDGDGARRWTFAPTPPLSTYVTVVNAGPVPRAAARASAATTSASTAASRSRRCSSATRTSCSTSPPAGSPGSASASRSPSRRSATTRSSCPTWAARWRTGAASPTPTRSSSAACPSYRERSDRANVVLHEMAHMWFGDLVTMRWWDDLWLNEAFASWAAAWAMAGATEFTDAWATDLLDSKLAGYRQDMSPATHPIRGDVPDVQQAMANFDAITYDKGEAVLHQLATYVGEDAFVEGLRAYFAAHAWGNTVLDDLMSAFAAASGRDLDRVDDRLARPRRHGHARARRVDAHARPRRTAASRARTASGSPATR